MPMISMINVAFHMQWGTWRVGDVDELYAMKSTSRCS